MVTAPMSRTASHPLPEQSAGVVLTRDANGMIFACKNGDPVGQAAFSRMLDLLVGDFKPAKSKPYDKRPIQVQLAEIDAAFGRGRV